MSEFLSSRLRRINATDSSLERTGYFDFKSESDMFLLGLRSNRMPVHYNQVCCSEPECSKCVKFEYILEMRVGNSISRVVDCLSSLAIITSSFLLAEKSQHLTTKITHNGGIWSGESGSLGLSVLRLIFTLYKVRQSGSSFIVVHADRTTNENDCCRTCWTESYLSKHLVTQLIWHANPEAQRVGSSFEVSMI
ncbi:hypothetical protein RIR_jg15703.t1 [Rhizophagus irregularis DAOM 181602=DAOM 197198]|nr:hypothetical protein RIR_jg15703.t1 [Rhizophagus irregularis DAOM 181602=DAOM 197198]